MSARRSSASDSVESLLGGDAKRRKLSDNKERKGSVFVLGSDDHADSERMPMSFPSRIKPKVTQAPKGDLDTELSEETGFDNGKMVDKTNSFGAMNVAPWLLASLSAMEIRCPTAIQKACIPDIIAGRSVIGGSKTGSGKTLTFAIPMLQKLAEDPRGIFGLVITPTRELALQIYEQFMAISYRFELKAALITGGQDWIKQTRALKEKPHIVIATPGRLADHIVSSGPDIVIALKRVQILVLDEADRLLAEDAGMLPHLETCLDALPSSEERQTCLFTATMTSEVLQLKDMQRRGSTAPISVYEVGLDDPAAVPASLRLTYLTVPAQYRDAYLHVLLQTPQNSKHGAIIVFANKMSTVNLLERLLKGLGHNVTSLHSGLQQSERIANLARFRASASRIIVATDVASRGLDIPQVGLVINYDVPASPDDYVHRVGRTARAGRTGEALTLVGPRDELRMNAIESRVGRLMVEFRQDGVNVETRVLRDSVKIVGEIKRKVLIGIEEGRDAKGNRNIRHLKRLE